MRQLVVTKKAAKYSLSFLDSILLGSRPMVKNLKLRGNELEIAKTIPVLIAFLA